MKARGGRFLLIVGAGLAVMAFVVVYLLMSKSSLVAQQTAAQAVPTAPPTRSVVVARADIPAYTLLDDSNTYLTDVDASVVETNTTSDISVVAGKMSTVAITKGAQIQTSVLTQQGFSAALAKGEKGFALAIPPRNAFGGALTEGDHVDVLWTSNLTLLDYKMGLDGNPTAKDTDTYVFTTTKTMLQDLRVVRILNLQDPVVPKTTTGTNASQTDQTTQAAQAAQADTVRPGDVQTAAMYTPDAAYNQVLILAMTDQQAEVLKFLNENGRIDLTLRSSAVQKDAAGKDVLSADSKPVVGDNDPEKTTGVTLQMLQQQYGLILPTGK